MRPASFRFALVPSLVLLASCPAASIDKNWCFGFDRHPSIAVHLREVASETGYYWSPTPEASARFSSSCMGFDGVVAGGTYTFSSVDLAVATRSCSMPVADVTGPGIGTVSTLRNSAAATAYRRSDAPGPTTVSVGTTIAGCQGKWIFTTEPYGLAFRYPSESLSSSHWPDSQLFDQLTPGASPPVVIVREFVVDDAASCPALGLPQGEFGCSDVFSGYYEMAP